MKKYRLYVSVRIDSDEGDHLNVSEDMQVNVRDFMEIATILGQFHELAQTINLLHKAK